MTVARFYRMDAPPGGEAALHAALETLAALVRPLPGCEGVVLMQDRATRTAFTFIERWASVEAHKAAGARLGKEAIAPVMAALAGPPQGSYLDELRSL